MALALLAASSLGTTPPVQAAPPASKPRTVQEVRPNGPQPTAATEPVSAPAGPTPAPPPDEAPPSRDQMLAAYEDAVNYFKYQDFEKAVPLLRGLLYGKDRLPLGMERELRAREYLGAALWWQGKRDEALDEFTALLVAQPKHHLDPALYPPRMIEDFEAKRRKLVETGVLRPDQAPRLSEPVEPGKVEPPPFGLTLFPFGVGQLANRDTTKGVVLLVTEVALASVSAAWYVSNVEAGARGPRPFRDDAIQIGTGAAFFLVAGYGIWDAVTTWRAQRAATSVKPPAANP